MDPRFPEPKLRAEFRKELRARLMQEAPAALAPRRGTAWTFLRPAFAVGLAALVLIAGAGTAAAGSLPGDPAFVLKRTFEDVQVSLTFDEVQRVQLLAQLADRRLQELQQITNTDQKDAKDRDGKAVAASEEFAKAVAQFRAVVDQVQTAAPQDTSDKVQQVVDDARDKHGAIVDQLQLQVSDDKAKDALGRARDDEDKDTKEEQKGQGEGKDDPSKTARPSRSPSPSRSPRASQSPRAGETPGGTERPETARPATPRPTGTATPRITSSPRPSGEQKEGSD